MNKLIEALEGKIRDLTPQQPFVAIVKTTAPGLTLEYLNKTIPTEQIWVLNYLLPNYKRKYNLEGVILKQHQDVSEININFSGGSTEVAEGHAHPMKTGSGAGTIESTGDYAHTGTLTLLDTLRVGCEVLIQPLLNGYCVIGQVVKMPNTAQGGA